MRSLLVVFISILGVFQASAWGPKGHDIVAYIAEQHLSRRAVRNIEAVLGDRTMVSVANWMDNASHTEEYAHTKTWHYVNVDPSEQSYNNSAKAQSGDAVTAINTIIANIASGTLTAEQECAELMMLIHLMGDIHCPMHAGRKSDRGGNGVAVRYFGKNTNLHSVWDSDIVESAHRWSYGEWQQNVDRAKRRDVKRLAQGTPNDWIEETLLLAHDVYDRTPRGCNISYDYVAHYTPIIEIQFLKGGIRLAEILERLY
jgi:hypothetical protein